MLLWLETFRRRSASSANVLGAPNVQGGKERGRREEEEEEEEREREREIERERERERERSCK